MIRINLWQRRFSWLIAPRSGAWILLKKLSLFLLLLSPALVAGCRGGETPTPSPTPPSQTPAPPAEETKAMATPTATPSPQPSPTPVTGRLTLWHSWAQADGDALAAILNSFSDKYPNVAVEARFVAYSDLLQNYKDAVQAGGGPELMLAPNWWLGEMAEAGVILALDERIAPEQLAIYWPATVENLRWAGRLYGLPTHFEVISLYVNNALIDGRALPTTTDDLLTLARQNPQHGIGLYANLYHLYWGIPAYGGQLLDEKSRVILDQTSGAADFLRWLTQLNQIPGAFVAPDYGMLLDRFKKGEFAFFVDGPWSIDDLRQALGDALSVALLPGGPAGPAKPWLNADGVFLNPTSAPAQQQLALLLASRLTDAQSGGILAQTARRLPANRMAQVGADPLLQGFTRQAAVAQSIPTAPEMDEVWNYGDDMILKALYGVADPSMIVLETTTLINEANVKQILGAD
jgi:arabinogalactan oligomer/maltooligosaccharide transport system substrate-binding protein